jgi:hypothetical protein
MNESVKKPAVWGELTVIDSAGGKMNHETCEFRLYETSLVLMPTSGDVIRIHFSNIAGVEAKDYSIVIDVESGTKVIISKLGNELDNLARDLSDAMNALNIRTLAFLKELSPDSAPADVRSASHLMKEGKAAASAKIKSISPTLWQDIEKKLEQTQIWNEYQHLGSIARQDRIAVGIKRGLMGDLTGNYLWLMLPVYRNESGYGNAIAMESVRLPSSEHKDQGSDQDLAAAGGNATYFFRIAEAKDYSHLAGDPVRLDMETDRIVHELGQLMLDINFRREPIFLSDQKLKTDPQYAKYRYAAQKIPSLRKLRRLFIGRVIHSSFEQWKSDVASLLEFNKTAADGAKWEKS